MDLTTVLLLAVVLWLDGWRRVPREALVLRSTGLGGWRVVEPWARVGAFALVALWPPSAMPLVVTPTDAGRGDASRWQRDFTVAVARGRRRLRRTRVQVGALRAIGVLLVGWIVVGIPLATARSGIGGLLLGIAGAFCLSTWLAIVVAGTVRELGAPWRTALRASAPLVSPFAAVRAPEVVVDQALGSGPPLARVAALLDRAELDAWLAPHAYDVLHGSAFADGAAGLVRLVAELPRPLLERAASAALRNPEREADAPYCPRCARSYAADASDCADCAGVALVRGGTAVTPS